MLRPVETPQVCLLSGQSLQVDTSAGLMGLGPLYPVFPYEDPREDPTTDAIWFQWWFWILAKRARACAACREHSSSLEMPLPRQRKKSGQLYKQEWRTCYMLQEGLSPKREKWHSLVKRDQPCFYWFFLHLSKGRLGNGFSGERQEGRGGRERERWAPQGVTPHLVIVEEMLRKITMPEEK